MRWGYPTCAPSSKLLYACLLPRSAVDVTHKEFFDKVATQKGFDPSEYQHWYNVNHSDIVKLGGASLLYCYARSHIRAILHVYPQLQLDPSQFKCLQEQKIYYNQIIAQLFPEYKVLTNPPRYQKYDIYIPKARVAFVFQVVYTNKHTRNTTQKWSILHYLFIGQYLILTKDNHVYNQSVDSISDLNYNAGYKSGVSRIIIRSWWNTADFSSILAELHKKRPDLGVEAREAYLFQNTHNSGAMQDTPQKVRKQRYASLPFQLIKQKQSKIYPKPGLKSLNTEPAVTKSKVCKKSEEVLPLALTRLAKPRGYWTKDEGVHMRQFLDALAERHQLDPLQPETWYKIKMPDVVKSGGSQLLRSFNFSYPTAVSMLYPEIVFEKEKFQIRRDWSTASQRRQFFDSFARNNNFDPLVPENWYKLPVYLVRLAGGAGLLNKYGGSYVAAICDIYPDIGLKRELFPAHLDLKTRSWKTEDSRRDFLISVARARGLDPWQSSTWNQISKKDIIKEGGHGMFCHTKSLVHAVNSLFPTVQVERNKHLRKQSK